jgi:hypothetical protein
VTDACTSQLIENLHLKVVSASVGWRAANRWDALDGIVRCKLLIAAVAEIKSV